MTNKERKAIYNALLSGNGRFRSRAQIARCRECGQETNTYWCISIMSIHNDIHDSCLPADIRVAVAMTLG